MYSQIFYIDPDEDAEVVKKKIKESRKEKIILVLPEENKNLKNIQNLTILKKEAQSLNKKLTIFSTDRHYRNFAEDCGIEIEETLIGGSFFKEGEISFRPKVRDILPRSEIGKEHVQNEKKSDWQLSVSQTSQAERSKEEIKEKPKEKKSNNLLFYFLLFILFVCGAAFSLIWLPKATITLIPTSEEIEFFGAFSVKKDGNLDIKTKIAGGALVEKEKEVEKSFLASGSEKRVDKAKGKVTIYNETLSIRKFIAGTRFESPEGKIFKSQDYISLPSSSGGEPGKVEIEVVALEAGEEYNIGPSDFTLPGLKPYGTLYEKIYAKSSEPMEGGFIGETKVVLKEDIEKAKTEMSKLEENLIAEAKKEILDKISPNAQFLKDEILVEKGETIFDKNAGDIGETFKGVIKVKAKLLVPKEEDIQEIIAEIVKNKIKEGIDFEEVISSQTVEYKILKSDQEKGLLEISFSGKEKVALKIEVNEVKEKALGMTGEEFRNYIEKEMGGKVKDAKIEFWPFWVSKIPQREERVSVLIKYD